MTKALDILARHHGLTLSYDNYFTGDAHPVPDQTKRFILEKLGVDVSAPPAGKAAAKSIRVPKGLECWLPDTLLDHPGWGFFCQLYELRSARNWGIGDFADLADLAKIAGRHGADFLGINPVHALFSAAPDRRSPFSPSNRRFLNPLYIAPDLLGAAPPHDIDDLRKGDLVDYPAVARVKLAALREVFDHSPHSAELDAFVAQGGDALRDHAVFEAISAHMVAQGHEAGWLDWPDMLQDPKGDAVALLADDLAADVRFHLWLQMVARKQLDAAAHAATEAGMRIGLYLDLAVGEAPDGSATWSGAAASLDGLRIGAPPDMYAAQGQNWGLVAPSPTALKDTNFAPFRQMIAAQMRSAGALRIDHAMALWQLYLIPEGESPTSGTHLRYPFADYLRHLSDLSHSHKALVIGEDLGFVPDGFQTAMEMTNILSYRILIFEQSSKGFNDPSRYPRKALACLSTHDLPVLAAWWTGDDIANRRAFGQLGADQSDEDLHHRGEERRAMLRAFRKAGTLDAAVSSDALDADATDLPDAVLDAAHRFLARTPACLVGVRLADLVGPVAPTNLPGTFDEYPNWCPKSPVSIDAIEDHARFRQTVQVMQRERPPRKDGA